MADEGDIAAAWAEREREALLARRQAPAMPPATGPCRSCGGEVEPRRRATLPHTTLCASCAHDASRRPAP